MIDQDLPAFVIAENGKPVGTIEDGDSVIFFNFRGDRSIEISKSFDAADGDFDKFDRVRVPKVLYAGMLEYDGDLHIPKKYLVSPPEITNTMGEYLAATGISVLNPGIASNLSIVPPVCPSPRPLIFATLTPKLATIGATTRLVLSPTPPVECLSTRKPLISEKSKHSPESRTAKVRAVVSSKFMP